MPPSATPGKTPRNRTCPWAAPWREFLFWLLLVPASAALSSGMRTRQLIGLIETCAFLAVAISSAGRMKSLGLEFIAWERIPRTAVVSSATIGFAAGLVILGIARWSRQPLRIEYGWNIAVLVIVVGPALEEIIFRGYLLTLAISLTSRMPRCICSAVSIIGVAVAFGAAHLGRTGITILQFVCIVFTGCVYGWIRLYCGSTLAAVVSHATYNWALYMSACCRI
jgi:membrane protease YdiL (CAAX protease family)